ncbi:phage major capsid protein [Candidatus Bathyarchaeota archaeon]|nr:MAG: phage major capsid protein [Candidatus Bathyarchaeota archaeon]
MSEKEKVEKKEEEIKEKVEEKTEIPEIKVDTSDLQKRLDELTAEVKAIVEGLKQGFEALKPKEEPKGKGIIESNEKSRLAKIVESLKSGSLREQWTVPVDVTSYERFAGLRNHVTVTNILRGKQGATVNIPYVKDFDFNEVTVGGTLTEKTNLVGSVTATITEYGAYAQIPYDDIEEYGEQIISSLEKKFVTAAIRAEDKEILDTIIADTNVPEVDKSGATSNFDADWVAEAISKLMQQGKNFRPGDAVLCISPGMYEALAKDIAGSQPLTAVRPEVVRDGMISEFMGCRILIPGYLPEHDTTNHYLSAFLITRNAVVLAPKREMLVETERDTVNRKIKITGSHTFAVALVDNKAVVEIKTPSTT